MGDSAATGGSLANKEKKKKSCAWQLTDCLKVFLSFRVYNYMKTGDGEDSFDLPSFVAKEEKKNKNGNKYLFNKPLCCFWFIHNPDFFFFFWMELFVNRASLK